MHISASPSSVPENYHFTCGPSGLGADFDIKRICLGKGMCSKLSPPGIYLLRWGGLGKGVVGRCVRAQPGYVMAGRERDRQEPVLMPIPASATSEAPLSLRAARLCWMFRVKFRNTTVPPTLLSPHTPPPFDFLGARTKQLFMLRYVQSIQLRSKARSLRAAELG